MTLLDEVISGASSEARIATLLRQVKILASRTGADPLDAWIDQELNGYGENAELPPYRGPIPVHVLGHFVGFGTYAEDVPIPSSTFDAALEADELFQVRLRQPIATIESMAAGDGVNLSWGANIIAQYNGFLQSGKVQPVVSGGLPLVGAKMPVSRHTLAGVLDGVRNRILELALQLEKVVPNAGQLNAPDAEQSLAATVINYHFHGDANVAIDSTHVKQSINPPAKGDVDSLVHFLEVTGLPPDRLTELRDAAKADEKEHEEGPGRWKEVRRRLAELAIDADNLDLAITALTVAQAAIGFFGRRALP